MKRFNLLIAIICLGILVTSCNKDDGPKDEENPVVSINSPSATSTITVADVIELRANITDDTKLATILVSSTLGSNNEITNFDSETSHDIAIDLTPDPTTPAGIYTLTIVATDDAGNTGSDEVEITVE
jgi:hypothetical protein